METFFLSTCNTKAYHIRKSLLDNKLIAIADSFQIDYICSSKKQHCDSKTSNRPNNQHSPH